MQKGSDMDRSWVMNALRTAAGIASLPLLASACSARLLSEEAAWRAAAAWSARAMRLLGLQLAVEDENPGGWPRPAVLVGLNQASLIEVLAWYGAVREPFASVMNLEFALYPFLGWATWASGGIPLVRQWPAQARAALERAEERLRAGRSVAISIEGRRS